jgi:hypothetical protein
LRKHNDLSVLGNRIAHKSLKSSIDERFEHADQILGTKSEDQVSREKITRKSDAFVKEDIRHIQQIKDKCLNKRVVLNDSHIIRIALMLASELIDDMLVEASLKVPKLTAGRPKTKKEKH